MIFDVFTHKRLDERQTEQKAGYTVPESVKLSEQLFDFYKSSREPYAKKAKDWDDFRRGYQLTKEEVAELKKRRQPPLVLNVIEPAVEQAKAMLTTNKPRFSSTGRDDSDTRTGKMFSDLLSYIWEISDGNMRLKQAIDEYYVRGMGVMMAYHDPFADYGKGEVFITSVDSFDVYIDPNTTDPYARDAGHIIISKIMTAEQIQIAYPQYRNMLTLFRPIEGDDHPVSSHQSSYGANDKFYDGIHYKYRMIDRYTKVKDADYRITGNGDERVLTEEQYLQFLERPAVIVSRAGFHPEFITSDDLVQQYLQIAQKFGKTYHLVMDPASGQPMMNAGAESPQMIPNSTTHLEIVTMNDMIEYGVLQAEQIIVNKILRVMSCGGVLLYEGVMDIDNYPIVTLMNHHDRTPYPLSDVAMVKDLQEQINKIESLLVAHASNSTNTKIFFPSGSVNKKDVKERWTKAGTEFFEYNPEIGKPEQFYPPALPTELYQNKAQKIQEVERVLGIYALQQGDGGSAPQTYKGTVALDEYGQRRIKSKKDDIEGALNALAKVVIQLIQQTYTEEKTIRLIQPNNAPRELIINQPIYDDFGNVTSKVNDVTVGKYDVIVVSGSMLPSNRWAQFDYYYQLFQAGAIDQVELLKKTEIVDVEGVLNRHSQMVQMQQTIQSLQDEIKSLRGDLQTATRESVHDKKRLEVEKFKTKLNDASGDAKKASQIYTTLKKNEYDMQAERLGMDRKIANSSIKQRERQ